MTAQRRWTIIKLCLLITPLLLGACSVENKVVPSEDSNAATAASEEVRKYTFMDCIWLTASDFSTNGNVSSTENYNSTPDLLALSYMIYETIPQEIIDTKLFDEIYNGVRYCQRKGFGLYRKLEFKSIFSDFQEFSITFTKEDNDGPYLRIVSELEKKEVGGFVVKLLPDQNGLAYDGIQIVSSNYAGKKLDMESIRIAWNCVLDLMLQKDPNAKLSALAADGSYGQQKIDKFASILKELQSLRTSIYDAGLSGYLVRYYLSTGNAIDMKQFIVINRMAQALLTAPM